MARIENLPITTATIRDGVVVELEHLTHLVEQLTPQDWARASAVESWTIGDVVAHLDLFVAMYGRFLSTIIAGRSSGATATLIGWAIGSILPSAAPVFDIINGAIPKVMNRLMAPAQIRTQFAAGAHNARSVLLRTARGDDNRQICNEAGPYPLWFYLGVVLNELAIHGWDIQSRINKGAPLSDAARGVLPWFYWSSSRLMLRPPASMTGTVQVQLTDWDAAFWWSVSGGSIQLGRGRSTCPDVEIRGASGAYVLALAGRVTSRRVLLTDLQVHGYRELAEVFVSSWHLI